MSEPQAAPGLMQAIAPIVKRRPVHIIVSDGADGALHVVFQPLRVDDNEDAEAARGFSVEAPPEELDADLPQHVAEHWVPARMGLQSVLDQIRDAAEQTRQATVTKAKEGKGGRKPGATADAGAQTTILAPAAAAPSPQPPASPAASTAAACEAPVAAAEPAPEAEPAAAAAEQEATPTSDEASAPPVALATASQPLAAATADGVSDLFA